MLGFTLGGRHSSTLGVTLRRRQIGLIPATRDIEVIIPGRPGVYDYRTEYDKRQIELEVWVQAADRPALLARLRDVAAWIDPARGAQALVFDDEPDREWRVKATGQPEVDLRSSWASVALSLKMADPFVYATSADTTAFDLASGASAFVSNDGSVMTPLAIAVMPVGTAGQPLSPASGIGAVYTASAALLNPRLTLGGVTFAWSGEVAPGEVLEIDTEAMTVAKDGQNVLGGWSGDFPALAPGLNEISYRDDVGGFAHVSLTWRRRWL